MKKMKMGNVSAWREGDHMHFECECGANEFVEDYENRGKPEKFAWQMSFNYEHARCNECGKEYNGEDGKKYN